jgi:hypothetical protein
MHPKLDIREINFAPVSPLCICYIRDLNNILWLISVL